MSKSSLLACGLVEICPTLTRDAVGGTPPTAVAPEHILYIKHYTQKEDLILLYIGYHSQKIALT